MKTAILLLLACCVSSSLATRVICYYGSWSVYRNPPAKFQVEDIDPFLCTHLIYTFVGLSSYDAGVRWLDAWNDIGDDWKVGAVTKMYKLREANPNLKLMVAIGGWNEGSESYSRVMNDDNLRRRFVDNCVNFTLTYDFDGFDLDWEYPTQRGGIPSDRAKFSEMVIDLSTKLHAHGKFLSAAVTTNCHVIPVAYDVPVISQYLDSINVMSYDFYGAWDKITGHNAPLYSSSLTPASESHLNVAASAQCWVDNGASREKISLGVPFYGRSFTLSDPSKTGLRAPASGPSTSKYIQEAGFFGYTEICAEESTWTVTQDAEMGVPYAVRGSTWLGYDDEAAIQRKVEFIMREQFGGVMAWTIETDDFHGKCGRGKYPLLNTIWRTLGQDVPAPQQTTSAPSTTKAPTTSAPTTRGPEPTTSAPTTSAPTTRAPAGTLSGASCSAVGETFRDPANCGVFYTCVHNNSGGFDLYRTTCAPGTSYSTVSKVCDYTYNVDC